MSGAKQSQLLRDGNADILFANPFDAVNLIREHGYITLARHANRSNEIVIVAKANSGIDCVEKMRSEMTVAYTANYDAKLIDLRARSKSRLM